MIKCLKEPLIQMFKVLDILKSKITFSIMFDLFCFVTYSFILERNSMFGAALLSFIQMYSEVVTNLPTE